MADEKRSIHPVLLWAVLAAALAGGAWQASHLLDNADFLPVHDFCEYWAAGLLNLHGQDPYDPQLLYDLQKPLGLKYDEPIMMWNPPWTLSLVMPLGLLPFRVAHLLFLAIQMAAIIFSADLAWRLYGGPAERRWLAWLLAGLFLPTMFLVKGGQISGLLLLGAVGFLYFEQRGQLFLAGVLVALMGIKPQMMYLFWFALLFWSIERRNWQVIAGGVAAGLAASILPLLYNPDVFAQYWQSASQHAPTKFISLTLGTPLRLLAGETISGLDFDGRYFYLTFVPPLLTVVLLAWYWFKQRRDWDWAEEMPLLLLVSYFTTAYGAWPSDLVLLLIPVMQAATWVWRQPTLLRPALAIYVGINGLALVLSLLNCDAIWFAWMAPALLAGWLALRRLAGRVTPRPA